MHHFRFISYLPLLLALGWLGGCGGAEPVAPTIHGQLVTIGLTAPGGSAVQFLGNLADSFGWEGQVAQNSLLRQAVEEGAFEDKVEPFLLSLFFKNGFSVLPLVGDGHQFTRDTVVQGLVQGGRFLVPTRNSIKIIFLQPVINAQIVYPQDGEQPQIFTLDKTGVVAVRRSQLEQYLR